MQAMVLWWAEQKLEALRVADEAVAAANRSGSAIAISHAHCTRAGIVMETDLRRADLDATICWEQASASGNLLAVGAAHLIRQMISWQRGDLRR